MAHLLILELPGGNDTDLLQAAMDRGDTFTFLTAQQDHYQQQPKVWDMLGAARDILEITPFDYAEVEARVLAIHAISAFDAVLCLIDTRVVEAARLAARLGCRHLNHASAVLLRDKFNVRCRLRERGIAQPEFELATSNAMLTTVVEHMGLPVLIKPCDGYGSQNIIVLRYPEDRDPLLCPLDDFLPSHADYGLGVLATDRLLVERYMPGTVIGCDTMTIDGRHRLLGINEKIFFEPPSFAIRGGCFKANTLAFQEIEQYVFAALDAVDFDWGAAHTELMITDDGPRLIEINPRLVGAKIARLVGYALDASVHKDLIALHVGETVPPRTAGANGYAVTRWLVANEEGAFDHVDLPNSDDPRIRCVEILKKPGDYVGPPFENADRIGYVMVCSHSQHEAELLADAFIAQCKLTIYPL